MVKQSHLVGLILLTPLSHGILKIWLWLHSYSVNARWLAMHPLLRRHVCYPATPYGCTTFAAQQ